MAALLAIALCVTTTACSTGALAPPSEEAVRTRPIAAIVAKNAALAGRSDAAPRERPSPLAVKPVAPARDDPWTLTVSTRTAVHDCGDLEAGGVGPVFFANRVAFSVRRAFHIASSATLSVAYERRDYDFGGRSALFDGLGSEPGEVQTLGASLSVFQPLSPTWAVFASAGVARSTEDSGNLLDVTGFTGVLGVGCQVTPRLQLGAGLISLVRLDEDPYFIPVPQFEWLIGDSWRLATEEAGGSITYRPNREWSIAGLLDFDTRRYRLGDEGPAERAWFEDSRTSLELRARWTPARSIRFEGAVGLDVYRYLAALDDEGRLLRDDRPDPGVFVRLGLSFSW